MSAEIDPSTLLDALHLDRAPSMKPPARPWRLIGIAAVVVSAGALGAYVWFANMQTPIANVRVVTAEVARSPVVLDASGYVAPRRTATLSAKILGKLVEVDIEEGERVEAGQVIARLDDSNFAAALSVARAQETQAGALLVQAETALENIEPNYRRYVALLKEEVVSKTAFEQQKAAYDAARTGVEVARRNLEVAKASVIVAQANVEDTIVRAPFAGVVTDKSAQIGEIVSPIAAGGGFTRTGIATIVDMETLEVVVDVGESDIDRVRIGQRVTITLNAYPGWEIPGAVIATIPAADEAKGTVKVRISFDVHGDARILPRMGARVSFMTGGISAAPAKGVIVPRDAVLVSGREAAVFIVRADGRLERRRVHLGATGSGGIAISSGVASGERLAAGEVAKLRDGMALR